MRSVVLVALAACHHQAASSAHPTTVPTVALCKTTESELRAALGEPTRDGYLHGDRVLSWVVGRGRYDVIQYLAVLLDGHGVVVDRVWNVPSEVPWVPASQCPAPPDGPH